LTAAILCNDGGIGRHEVLATFRFGCIRGGRCFVRADSGRRRTDCGHELYIDDLLMPFFYLKAMGRIGFISQESEVTFSKLRFYSMDL
jgi:hypothetical protein